jgi:hypothetical protein
LLIYQILRYFWKKNPWQTGDVCWGLQEFKKRKKQVRKSIMDPVDMEENVVQDGSLLL